MTIRMPGRPAAINGWRMIGWATAVMLLLLPLAAMRITPEVAWTASDFAFAAGLIGALGAAAELALRPGLAIRHRLGIGLVAVACVVLTWINAAVGVFGQENDRVNLVYYATIVIAVMLAMGGRFRPDAVRHAAAVAAGAVAAAGVMGVIAMGYEPRAVAFQAGLVAMFVLAAFLCRRSLRARV